MPKGGTMWSAGDVDQIAHDRRRGRSAAGARPDQHHVADEIAIDGDAVRHAINFGDRRVLRHHGRVHALLDAALSAERDAEQLDAISEIAGSFDIGGRDRFDPLDIDGLEARARAEGEAGEKGNLCAVSKPPMSNVGSASAYPCACASFSTSAKVLPSLLHQRQDVIAGAVEDAVDAARCRCLGGSRASP